jgi:hypothetical protein
MRKIVLCATALLFTTQGFCQINDSLTKFVFGFNLGLNYANTQLKTNNTALQHKNSAGFKMGLLLDWKLTDRLSFSPKAELSFNDSRITVLKNPDIEEVYELYPVTMEFASHFTYKVLGTKTAAYVLLGPSCRTPLKNKKIKSATQRTDIAVDFGIGLDKKLTYFNIAPELRYSLGLMNLSAITEVEKIYFHNISLVLNFKG